jgi:CD109 antigen
MMNFLLRLTDDFKRVVHFDVTVEEALTGRRQNNSGKTILHKHKYKLDLVKTSEYFKPGLKYTAFVRSFFTSHALTNTNV